MKFQRIQDSSRFDFAVKNLEKGDPEFENAFDLFRSLVETEIPNTHDEDNDIRGEKGESRAVTR